MSIYLIKEEIQEAILEYLRNHRPDFIDPAGDKVPAIRFINEGKEVSAIAAEVDQLISVHHGENPYR